MCQYPISLHKPRSLADVQRVRTKKFQLYTDCCSFHSRRHRSIELRSETNWISYTKKFLHKPICILSSNFHVINTVCTSSKDRKQRSARRSEMPLLGTSNTCLGMSKQKGILVSKRKKVLTHGRCSGPHSLKCWTEQGNIVWLFSYWNQYGTSLHSSFYEQSLYTILWSQN